MQVELHCQAVSVQHKKYTRVLKKQTFHWSLEQRSGELPAPTQPTVSPVEIIDVDQCEDWNCTFGQNSFRWGGCLCVKRECLSKPQNTVLSAHYKMILFFWQDKRPRYWYPVPGGQRRAVQDEKERIEGLGSCLANAKMALTGYRFVPHFRAVSRCSLCSQAEKRQLPLILLQRNRSALALCCSYPVRPEVISFEDRETTPCVSITCTAHRIRRGEGAAEGQPGLCLGRGQTEVAPWPCPCKELHWQTGASCGRAHSFTQASPGASTWRSKKLIGQGFLLFPFLFPVSCAVPYLAYALGSPGVSQLFMTAGKAP